MFAKALMIYSDACTEILLWLIGNKDEANYVLNRIAVYSIVCNLFQQNVWWAWPVAHS